MVTSWKAEIKSLSESLTDHSMPHILDILKPFKILVFLQQII